MRKYPGALGARSGFVSCIVVLLKGSLPNPEASGTREVPMDPNEK